MEAMTTTYPETPMDSEPFLDEEWPLTPEDEDAFIVEPDDAEIDPGPWDIYADMTEQYGFREQYGF